MNRLQTFFEPDYNGRLDNRQLTAIIGLAFAVAVLITWAPIINLLDYPFRLLLTFVHELGHGIAAMLTGGDFRNFSISLDGSGVAYSAGGWRWVIIPAGYLGVAIFAALLILAGRSHRSGRIMLGLLGGIMVVLALWFGPPDELSFSAIGRSILTVGIGLLFGGGFLYLAFKAKPAAILFVLYLIAIKAGMTAFTDIYALIGMAGAPGLHTDAHSMAELTHLPVVFWAITWIVAALVIIGGAVWVTWKPGRKLAEHS